MAPLLLHVMRHGQGFHSPAVSKDGHLIRDPHLTDHGKSQCRQTCEQFTRHGNIDLLIASPMRRTLQTCKIAMNPCVERGMKVNAIPYAMEVSSNPEDTGSPLATLTEEFGDSVNFEMIADNPENWFVHEGEFLDAASDPNMVKKRAAHLRKWIKARPEKEIALATHGYFAHFITGDVTDNGEQLGGDWQEAELRSFNFVDGDDEARLRETEESKKKRNSKN